MQKAIIVIFTIFLLAIINGICFYFLFYYVPDTGSVGGAIPGLNRVVGPIIGVFIGSVIGLILGLIIVVKKLRKIYGFLLGMLFNGFLPSWFLYEQLFDKTNSNVLKTSLIVVPIQILFGGIIGLIASHAINEKPEELDRLV